MNQFSGMWPLPRQPSPAFGSPIQLDAPLDDDGEVLDTNGGMEVEHIDGQDGGGEELEMSATKREQRKGKGKEREMEKERDLLIDVPRSRDRERKRAREDDEFTGGTVEGIKLKLKDVTNSPRSRSALPPLDANAVGAWTSVAANVLPACTVPLPYPFLSRSYSVILSPSPLLYRSRPPPNTRSGRTYIWIFNH